MTVQIRTTLGIVILISLATTTGLLEAGVPPDPIRGGRIWDRWWVEVGVAPPVGEHLLYPAGGPASGSATTRCKECHGWDYKGAAGAYGAGSEHYTGINGVFGSTLTSNEMFDMIKLDSTKTGHGFGNLGMTDQDVNDVVAFLQTMLIDTDDYIDAQEQFIGNATAGQFNYNEGGMISCVNCHGPSGTWMNFGTPEDPEWLGTHAVHHPTEVFHKIRMGNPGTPMPSWIAFGGTAQGAADIGNYVQLNFPTNTCSEDCGPFLDGRVDITDLLAVLSDWGYSGTPTDIDSDGTVGIADLLAVLGAWGLCP